jgi:phosphoenolpyruvate carboxykinase (GTP)
MADYFEHWLEIGRRKGAKLPRLYNVNWFRKDLETGDYLWPGFGDNSRVLKWAIERIEGAADAVETPIGFIPTPQSLDLAGLDMTADDVQEAVRFDADEWRAEVPSLEEWFDRFGGSLPRSITRELEGLKKRLG